MLGLLVEIALTVFQFNCHMFTTLLRTLFPSYIPKKDVSGKAQHLLSPVSEVPRQDVDAELKSKVLSQFRDLGVDPSSLGDDNFVNMLLTPSEKRSNAFKKILFSIEPELEAELEGLELPPKKTLEETQLEHLLTFCHEIGLEYGEEGLKRIKGEVAPDEHLLFWINATRFAITARDLVTSDEDDEEEETMVEQTEDEVGNTSEVIKAFCEMRAAETKITLFPAEFLKELGNLSRTLSKNDCVNMLPMLDQLLEEQEANSVAGDVGDIAHPTSQTKLKLLLVDLRDLIQVFIDKFDSSLEYCVRSTNSETIELNRDLGGMLQSACESQDQLRSFADAVKTAVEDFQRLQDFETKRKSDASNLDKKFERQLKIAEGEARGTRTQNCRDQSRTAFIRLTSRRPGPERHGLFKI